MRCCRLDLAALVPAGTAGPASSQVLRAAQAQRDGQAEVAARLCLDVLDQAPGEIAALALLCEIRRSAGQDGAAEALAGRIVALDPNHVWATIELALVLLARGALAEAEQYARDAVRLAPENPQTHNLMGMILTEAHRPQVGEFHYRRVLTLSAQHDPILLANLAWHLKTPGADGGGPRAV